MLLEKACVMTDELETMASEELPSDQMGRGVGRGEWMGGGPLWSASKVQEA